MKELKRTRTIEEVYGYESNDGNVFKSKEECEKYENGIVEFIRNMFNKLVIARMSESELFYEGGTEGYIVALVKCNSITDVEIANRYISECNKGIKTRYLDDNAIGKEIFISLGYDYEVDNPFGQCYGGYIYGTLEDIFKGMRDSVDTAKKKYEENK